MGRERRKRLEFDTIKEINVTPLMDLTFLLLIVFMITAPMLEYGLDVTLPKLNADAVDRVENIAVTITRDGSVIINRRPVLQAELEQYFKAVALRDAETSVLVRADESRPYGEIMRIMRLVRNAGIDNVSLVTEPEG